MCSIYKAYIPRQSQDGSKNTKQNMIHINNNNDNNKDFY